jgi:predicted nucleotidyltransferase component of viral defense system
MHGNIYRDKIYPFQDRILKVLEGLDLDFYLTGGTALSRCYLQHRYSDDLDLFVNSHSTFKNQCKTMINACKNKWRVSAFPLELLSDIKWTKELHVGEVKEKVNVLHDDIFRGNSNSLFIG